MLCGDCSGVRLWFETVLPQCGIPSIIYGFIAELRVSLYELWRRRRVGHVC